MRIPIFSGKGVFLAVVAGMPMLTNTLQIRCVKLCKVVYYMNHTTGLCGSYTTQLYTTFYTAYTTDLQCTEIGVYPFLEIGFR